MIWLNTNLDDSDVVNGGEKKLREAVLYAESEFRPDAIIVVNSCVPAIIGDDIDSILGELQSQVTAKIVLYIAKALKQKSWPALTMRSTMGFSATFWTSAGRNTNRYTKTIWRSSREKYRISRDCKHNERFLHEPARMRKS